MARISKPGLDYFPLDVNFLQDRKVRASPVATTRQGIAHSSLLGLIYQRKRLLYFVEQRPLFSTSPRKRVGGGKCRPSLMIACQWGCSMILYIREYGVLTSQAIQEQYHKIITEQPEKI